MAKANNVKLGIFVTIATVLFIYGLLRISEGFDLFGRTIPVYVHFQDVKGLQVGNNVRFAGIGVGEVKDIVIRDERTIRVQLELDAKVKEYLRKNATVDIATDGLVGNMIVSISPAEGEAAAVEAGDLLVHKPRMAIAGMLDELDATNEKIAAITENLLAITQKMNEGEGTLSLLLNDGQLARELSTTTLNLRQSTQQVNQVSRDFASLVSGINDGRGNLGYLLKGNTLEAEINQLSNNLDTLVSVRTAPILEELEHTSRSLLASSKEVESLLMEINTGEGVITTLLRDSTAANHLSATLANLDVGTEKFVTNMEALKSNWFFRGYFKKQEKRARKEARRE
ncbi:MlaD family protein [Lewinella sp. W8]|uniref:MlaD family protein n=1 Tax=Lewinella sp. W8 TaxID=2528208 RepID=UPI0015632CEE|nr:MlaD family protein [Lewinella sp. W8]